MIRRCIRVPITRSPQTLVPSCYYRIQWMCTTGSKQDKDHNNTEEGTEQNQAPEEEKGIWVEQIDPGTGHTFYFHTRTMEHRDKKPTEFKYQKVDANELPPPGTKLVRGLDGRLWEKYVTQPPWDREYFFHRPTKACTWDDPSNVPPEQLNIDDPDKPGPVAILWERFKAKMKSNEK